MVDRYPDTPDRRSPCLATAAPYGPLADLVRTFLRGKSCFGDTVDLKDLSLSGARHAVGDHRAKWHGKTVLLPSTPGLDPISRRYPLGARYAIPYVSQ
jgi:hypothetical protein